MMIKRISYDGLFIFMVLGISLVLSLGVFSRDQRSQEYRRLRVLPELKTIADLLAFPQRFEFFLNDNFRFRDELIREYSRLNLKLFNYSTIDTVVVGKDGWFFFAGENQLSDVQGVEPMPEWRKKEWAEYLDSRRKWLQARGVSYYFTVAPSAQSIYPEKLPSTVIVADGPKRYDQLRAYLVAHTQIQVIDLHEPLRQAKSEGEVFQRLDPHWSDFGEYVAYKTIVKAMAGKLTNLEPLALEKFERGEEMGDGGLARSLSLLGEIEDVVNSYTLVASTAAEVVSGEKRVRIYENTGQENKTLMIIGDSFMEGEIPSWLAEHIGRVVLIVRPFLSIEEGLLEDYEPDVVLEEVTERRLVNDRFELRSGL